jgi:hypothetical protein
MSTRRTQSRRPNSSKEMAKPKKKKSWIHRMMRRFPPVQRGEIRRWFTREFLVNGGTGATYACRFNINDIYRPQTGVAVSMLGFTAYAALQNQFAVWAVGWKLDWVGMDLGVYDVGIGFNTNDPGTAPVASTLANQGYRSKVISGLSGQNRASFSGQRLLSDIIGSNALYTADSFRGNFGGVSPADEVWGYPFYAMMPNSPTATIGPDFKLTLSLFTHCYARVLLT